MLLIKPYLGCNINCSYCYERNYRKKAYPKKVYNLDLILKRMEEYKHLHASLHGGEILTLPKTDVEKLLAKSFELHGRSSLQTNATMIDDDFIAMFKKYNTNVGVSWDGPDELSEYRPGTKKIGDTIERLAAEKISTSIIIVISKANVGTKVRFEKLKKFLIRLHELKITGRLNPCLGAKEFEVNTDRLTEVYLDLAEFCMKNGMRWSPFEDIINALQGKPRVCSFSGCDPFSTPSATVVTGDGSITNCMRLNKEGILLRHPASYPTRNEILQNTPQEYGGCQGCPFWDACMGGCPSGAINDDWRNRTYLCPLWKVLFDYFDKMLKFIDPDYKMKIGQGNSNQCQISSQPQGSERRPHGDSPHGDHIDSNHTDLGNNPENFPGYHEDGGYKHADHNDANLSPIKNVPHGDSPHGDYTDTDNKRPGFHQDGSYFHGDHTDTSIK